MEAARPVVCQLDARVWLREESRFQRRPVMLDSIPGAKLDSIAGMGFRWVALSGIWETAAFRPFLRSASSLEEFQDALPDLAPEDIDGPPFAVKWHRVRAGLGGEEALDAFRDDLARRDLKLMLDFVPGQVTFDHPWVEEHPEFFVRGKEDDLLREPSRYFRGQGGRVLARGLASRSLPWPGTLELNYRHPELRRAMALELLRIAGRAEGLRILFAEAVLPEVQKDMWGERSLPADGSSPIDRSFWLEALPGVRSLDPGVIFLAEADSRCERLLRDQGFDSISSALFRDALLEKDAAAVVGVLNGGADGHRKAARFLENQWTARAGEALGSEAHPAAAIINYLAP
jgi:glycosidase